MTQRPGGVLVYDAARPTLSSRQVNVDRLCGLILPGDTDFGRLVASLIREASEISTRRDARGASDFSPSAAETIAPSLRQSPGDGVASGKHLLRVKRSLRENLTESALTLERVASEQSISVWTLSRLFAAETTTPMRWLKDKCLEAAYRVLMERQACSVTEAADDCGFNNYSHITRDFKRSHGVTPKPLLLRREN